MWERGRAKLIFILNKSVVRDVTDKLSAIIAIKHMLFAFLVGDLPVFVLSLSSKLKTQTISMT